MYQDYQPGYVPPPTPPPVYSVPPPQPVVQPVIQPVAVAPVVQPVVVNPPPVVVQADSYEREKARQDAEDACCLAATCALIFCCICRALAH